MKLIFTAAALSFLAATGCAAPAAAPEPAADDAISAPDAAKLIAPDQWFKQQAKPVFKPGHTMPRLTRFGWTLDAATRIELAENWNYGLEFGGYLTDASIERLTAKPDGVEAQMVALAKADPKKYPLAIILSREEPPNPAPETFLRDAKGELIDGKKTYSPLNPQSVLDQMAELRARPLRKLRETVPIGMILNGGEYGLGVLGFMQKYAEQDPKVVAAKGENDWFELLSKAKGQERRTIADAVRKAVPDRQLYIYYNSGNVERNRFGGWKQWGYDGTYSQDITDLPSNEYYYKHFNTGYLPDAGGNDILTRALNATGFQIKNGQPNSYDWLSSGWIQEADGNGKPLKPKEPIAGDAATPELQEGNAAALVDPNAGVLSPMDLYTGFLKMLFTAGTLGGNAGYYALPVGGFAADFAADKPAHWAPQMAALSQVQALFSYLEDDLRKGELLPGPDKHRWSREQPAYEFPTSEKNVRVLARKRPDQNRWLITAWAADGVARPIKVSIPQLGELTLLARPTGTVYAATLQGDKPQLSWLDADALAPTAKGFAPQAVTPAQILARLGAPATPPQENLQLWFDAAQNVAKADDNSVASWQSGGALTQWKLNAPEKNGGTQWVANAINGHPAIRLDGQKLGLISDALPTQTALADGPATIFAVYASAFPQKQTAQGGNNNRLLESTSGTGATGLILNNGAPPVEGAQTWQIRMSQVKMSAAPKFLSLGGLVGGQGQLWNAFAFGGDVAEILVYSGELPAARQAQVKRYMSAKYQLAG